MIKDDAEDITPQRTDNQDPPPPQVNEYSNGYVIINGDGSIQYTVTNPNHSAVQVESGATCSLSESNSVMVVATHEGQSVLIGENFNTIAAFENQLGVNIDAFIPSETSTSEILPDGTQRITISSENGGTVVNSFSHYLKFFDEHGVTDFLNKIPGVHIQTFEERQAIEGKVMNNVGLTCVQDGQTATPVLTPNDIERIAINSLSPKK